MSQLTRLQNLGQVGLVAAGLAFAGCSGGGSSSSGASSDFRVLSVSVPANGTWQINRQIEIAFSQPIDFSTVNLNTISITQTGGGPASGEFRVKTTITDPFVTCPTTTNLSNIILFQPTCPTLDDFSDAGLTPGGVEYTLNIVGSTSGLTVQSTSGKRLGSSQTVRFTTPNSTQPSVLFIDPVVSSGPRPVLQKLACTNQPAVSYLELGNDPDNRVNLRERAVLNIYLGGEPAQAGFTAPLNFYSDVSSKIAFVVQIDQPVSPGSVNISADRVRLEYLTDEAHPEIAANWSRIAHTVVLGANCTQSGSVLRVIPTGILPQGRLVRVVLGPDFRDIVGNGNIQDQVVGTVRIATPVDPGTTNPGPAADEYKEEFTIGGTAPGSQQDTTTTIDTPPAIWGPQALSASFNFGGTGGPGGNFVYRVRPLANGTTVLNTSFTLITNEDQTASEPVVNGQVDVKDLIVEANAILEIKGPNPCVIRASGRVDIQGRILCRGANNRGVTCFSCANIPEIGSTGNGGGGKGGTGSILTTQSTPQGETGYGAFDLAAGGGGGGETGWFNSGNVDLYRGGGGGGGMFAIDVPKAVANSCPDQTIVGLDAEDGSPGAVGANSAIGGTGVRPKGGKKGPRPFIDLNPTDPNVAILDDDAGSPYVTFFHLNDFWGSMKVGNTIVRGELATPWAGAGGGGGGDSVTSSSFPTTPFNVNNNKKGAGGGGGGGSLTILCLGDIVFGSAGRIDAGGGTGGGGENTNGIDRVGGGSGGGSGGHVILQAGGVIDFRACVVGSVTNNQITGAGIYARGGEGGEGRAGVGGAGPNSIELPPTQDLLPPNAYAPISTCTVAGNTVGAATGTIDGCAGDGGPGVIQLHVSSLDKILAPNTSITTNKLSTILKPNPIGTLVETAGPAGTPAPTINTPLQWKQLLPIFGRDSKAISKWIPLGATSVPPTGNTPRPITFKMAGLTAAGLINSPAGTIPELTAVLSGTLATEPSLPFIAADGRTVAFDATGITDDIYIRNPALISQFELKIVGGTTHKFDVASATYDGTTHVLRVTVSQSGLPLQGLTGTVSLIPRFFRVSTDGVLDALPPPTAASVKLEFQAAPITPAGAPDEVNATPWTPDITTLNTTVTPANTALRFFRFRATFTIGIGSPSLSADTPIPSIEFLRVPFKF
jgi:hypothetical protein